MEISKYLDIITSAKNTINVSKKSRLDINYLREIEKKLGVELPDDLVDFYLISNGLEGDEFLFHILPFEELIKKNDDTGEYLEFAEYMIYAETCGLELNKLNKNTYKIFASILSSESSDKFKRKYVANSIVEFINLYLERGTYGIWGDENNS